MGIEASRSANSTENLRDLYRLMGDQYFVGARAQLLESGFSPSIVKSWCRTGRLIPVLHGVYSYGRDIDTREAAWKASLLLAGPGSALTGISACEAWGMKKPEPGIPRQIEIARPSTKSFTFRGRSPALRQTELKLLRRRIHPGDIEVEQKLELMRPAFALIEMASRNNDRDLLFGFLEACRLRLVKREDIEICFRRAAGQRGAKSLNLLLASWIPELNRIRSVLEGLFLLAWALTGRSMPLVNVKVGGFEVDMYWPEFDLVLELDGTAFHSDPVATARDLFKQRQLEESGLTVLRANFEQVDRRPAEVNAMVIGQMESRGSK